MRSITARSRVRAEDGIAEPSLSFVLLDRAILHSELGSMQAALDSVAAAAAVVGSGDELAGAVLAMRGAWEGDRMDARSAKNRLHAALSKLRKLGFREYISTEEAGYLIDPGIDVTFVED